MPAAVAVRANYQISSKIMQPITVTAEKAATIPR
jgi:hypothetical protein